MTAAPTPRRLAGILALDDFEAAARRHLPRPLFAYVSGGVETDASVRDNRDAFAEWVFLPSVLRETAARSTETELFGRRWSVPFGIAPMGLAALLAYRGDLARAAARCGMPMVVSGTGLIRLEGGRRRRAGELVPGLPAAGTRARDGADRPRLRGGLRDPGIHRGHAGAGQPGEQHPRRLRHPAAPRAAPRLGTVWCGRAGPWAPSCGPSPCTGCRISRIPTPNAARPSWRGTSCGSSAPATA